MKDVRKRSPDTLEEFRNSNYTLMVEKGFSHEIILLSKIGAEKLNHRFFSMATETIRYKDKDKVGFYAPRIPISYHKNIQFVLKGFDFPIKYIKEDLMIAHKGFGMIQNDVLYKTFRTGISRLFEAGITDIFSGKEMYEYFLEEFDCKIHDVDNHDGIVLTMELLKAGFLVWLGSVAIAITVFIGELVKFHIINNISRKRSSK